MDSGRPFFSGQEAKQRQVGVYAEIFGACVEDISGCLLGGDGLPVRVRFQVFVREVREQFPWSVVVVLAEPVQGCVTQVGSDETVDEGPGVSGPCRVCLGFGFRNRGPAVDNRTPVGVLFSVVSVCP